MGDCSETVTCFFYAFLIFYNAFFNIMFSFVIIRIYYHNLFISHGHGFTASFGDFPNCPSSCRNLRWGFCHNSFCPSLPGLYNLTVITTETCLHKDSLCNGSVSQTVMRLLDLWPLAEPEWLITYEISVNRKILLTIKLFPKVEIMIKATKSVGNNQFIF